MGGKAGGQVNPRPSGTVAAVPQSTHIRQSLRFHCFHPYAGLDSALPPKLSDMNETSIQWSAVPSAMVGIGCCRWESLRQWPQQTRINL